VFYHFSAVAISRRIQFLDIRLLFKYLKITASQFLPIFIVLKIKAPLTRRTAVVTVAKPP